MLEFGPRLALLGETQVTCFSYFFIVGLVTPGFFGMGGMLLRYGRSLPKTMLPEDAAVGKRISMWLGTTLVLWLTVLSSTRFGLRVMLQRA
jgi:hypothetical protein